MRGIRNGRPVEAALEMGVLYDRHSGDIVHVHRVVDFRTDQKSSGAEDFARRALELHELLGRDASSLNALIIDAAQFHPRTRYKVDVRTSALVDLGPLKQNRAEQ